MKFANRIFKTLYISLNIYSILCSNLVENKENTSNCLTTNV